jgi:hypothetical protein
MYVRGLHFDLLTGAYTLPDKAEIQRMAQQLTTSCVLLRGGAVACAGGRRVRAARVARGGFSFSLLRSSRPTRRSLPPQTPPCTRIGK